MNHRRFYWRAKAKVLTRGSIKRAISMLRLMPRRWRVQSKEGFGGRRPPRRERWLGGVFGVEATMGAFRWGEVRLLSRGTGPWGPSLSNRKVHFGKVFSLPVCQMPVHKSQGFYCS